MAVIHNQNSTSSAEMAGELSGFQEYVFLRNPDDTALQEKCQELIEGASDPFVWDDVISEANKQLGRADDELDERIPFQSLGLEPVEIEPS